MEKFLPAKARLHGHNENEVDFFEDIVDRCDGCCRIERNSGGGPPVMYRRNERFPGSMIRRLRMERNVRGLESEEFLQPVLGVLHHKMDVEGEFCCEMPDHGSPKTEIGDEMSVHDIHLKPVGIRLDGVHLVLKMGKITGEDGGGNEARFRCSHAPILARFQIIDSLFVSSSFERGRQKHINHH